VDRIKRTNGDAPIGLFTYDCDVNIDWNDLTRHAKKGIYICSYIYTYTYLYAYTFICVNMYLYAQFYRFIHLDCDVNIDWNDLTTHAKKGIYIYIYLYLCAYSLVNMYLYAQFYLLIHI
jgi:orotate phosphoribosyltransferase-like protein